MNEQCFEGLSQEYNPKGRCCCNCEWQQIIVSHPWNENPFTKGSIMNQIGYGCFMPDIPRRIVFMEQKHGMCECHGWRSE